MQNESEKFKENFTKRLIRFSIQIKESMPDFKESTGQLLKEAEEIAKVIGASVITLKGKR